MITSDQPTIFPANVRVGLSSIDDGSMKDGTELLTPSAISNRNAFMEQLGIDPSRAAIHFANFDTDDYCVYQDAVPGLMPGADAVTTDVIGQPIFLPLADCVGVVLYDPVHQALMVSHLGRHSTEQYGGTKSVDHMAQRYGSRPADIVAWLSPSPNSTEYPLWAFDNRSFNDVVTDQLKAAGIQPDHIEASAVDTVTDANYFSHSEFLKGNRATDGRYGIVAMLA